MIPTPWTVGRKTWAGGGGVDAHGNPLESWSDPVPVPVHGVAPRLSDEPGEARRWLVVEGLTVLAPKGTVIGEHDRVVWPFAVDAAGAPTTVGDEWEVDGPVSDWTRGPWPHPTAGVSFNLTRVEG